MRIVLAAVGGLAGRAIGGPGNRLFDVLIGAFAGCVMGELLALRAKLAELGTEIKRLRQPPASTAPHDPSWQPAATAAPAIAPARIAASTHTAAPASAAAPAPEYRQSGQPQSPVAAAIHGFVTGGNTLVRAGVIVLFFGVAFLLRYMAEHTRVPIELRLTGIAFAGLVMLALGWRLRQSRSGYAMALQGGGVGILYLTVFAALRLYGLIPAPIAFPLLTVVGVLSAALAVLQDSMAFALLGIAGGFLAPVLASSGQGSPVVLFSYYALLNAGILAVAWFKAWRPLNLAGFVFTFAIGTAWGVLRFRPDDFAGTEPFLVLFFLFYLGIAILYTLRQPADLRGYIDGTLIFGTPIVVFALQAAMLRGRPIALAYSAVAMSAVYIAGAGLLKRRAARQQALLIEAFIALGVALLTLAVPLALDARWNAATWALEGTAMIWVGCRQNRVLPRAAGVLLNLLSGLILANQFDLSTGRALLPFGSYLGVLTQSAAAAFAARTLHVHREQLRDFERSVPDVLFCWALLWWVAGGFGEIAHYLPQTAHAARLTLITVTTVSCSLYYRRVQLGVALFATQLQLPAMVIYLASEVAAGTGQPLAEGGWWAWPAAYAGLYYVMFHHEGAPRATLSNLLNAGSFWLLVALLSWECSWAVGNAVDGGASWPGSIWSALPALSLLLMPLLVTRIRWPFARNRDAYLDIAGAGIAVWLTLWSVATDVTARDATAPLDYWPLLNPLDLAQAFALVALARFWRFLESAPTANRSRIDPRLPVPALCALTFLWLNAMLLRTLHQWFAVPAGLDGIVESTLAQTSLSIFWAVLALATMVFATRHALRAAWVAGAVLLGITVIKLFLVDLSRIGSIERIVSFIGVGMLMLVVGYLSPIPPPARESA